MSEGLSRNPELSPLKSLYNTLTDLLRRELPSEGEYQKGGDCYKVARGEFVVDDYMDFILKGYDPKNQMQSHEDRLKSGRPALHIQGTDKYADAAVMIAYKADLDPASGFDFIAKDAPDHEPGSPDEEPFIYYADRAKSLDDAAKERLLQDIATTFSQ